MDCLSRVSDDGMVHIFKSMAIHVGEMGVQCLGKIVGIYIAHDVVFMVRGYSGSVGAI